MSLVLKRVEEGIAWITLNRPEKHNALNGVLLTELDQAFTDVARDPQVRVVVLSGAGEKAFAAGADIQGMKDRSPGEAEAAALAVQAIFNRIQAFPRPVVASIQGWALGGGLELALACHIRIASTSARLGCPEVGLGILPGYGATQRLPRLIGRAQALHLMLTGEPVTAEEALRMGLVGRICAPQALADETLRLAQTLGRRGPMALSAVIQAVNEGAELSLEEGLHLEARLFGSLEGSWDRQEGLAAFLERRLPDFRGR
ncbi:MAG: 3-hydroxybutyryl-CoA dehydratase [Holophagaceae bacterium]|nr:3-hydroxybutyryl-CoA dehydratase [Holophagaceae bacterium]